MASHRLSQLKSEDFVTVLFLADTQRAIATLQGVDGANQEGIREFTLRPWHDAAVRQWLQDVGIQSDRAMRDRIRKATGNWPILINRLGTAGTEALTRSCEDLANLPDNPVSTLGSEACFTIAKMAQKICSIGWFVLSFPCHNLSLNPSAKWSCEISSKSFFDYIDSPCGDPAGPKTEFLFR